VLHRHGESVDVQGRYVLAVNDGGAYLAAALAGLGIVRIPRFMSVRPLAQGDLMPLFEDWRIDPQPLYLAFPPNRHISAKLRVFIDWVVELMAEHAPIAEGRLTSNASARRERT
jgi:DNA-binding transcriptional LysR family regulator